jgi:hypothetical protein
VEIRKTEKTKTVKKGKHRKGEGENVKGKTQLKKEGEQTNLTKVYPFHRISSHSSSISLCMKRKPGTVNNSFSSSSPAFADIE